MIELSVGDTSGPHPIRALRSWNATGLWLKAGEQYVFTAAGRWTDFFIPTDADGYSSEEAPGARALLHKFEGRRRAPTERWFCLIGSVGSGGTPFRIGTRSEYTVPRGVTGELGCFANDVPVMYWNNRGAVQLTVERRR